MITHEYHRVGIVKIKTMPTSHHKPQASSNGAAATATSTWFWCLVSSAAILHMNIAVAVGLTSGPQNTSSIEQGSGHLLFPHHHHHHHHHNHNAPSHHHHRHRHHHLLNHHHRLSDSPLTGAASVSGSTCGKGHQPHQDDPSESASLSSSLLRAYIRTNSMRAYTLDLHDYRRGAKYAGDAAFVNSRDESHQERCRRHLGHYHQLLKAFRDTDPMEMTQSAKSLQLADVLGRPETGLLEGNQFWLGSYERCLDFKTLVPNNGDLALDKSATAQQVSSQYCLGSSQFPSWNPVDTKTSIKIGMCLPETCTSSMLNEQKDLFEMAEQMVQFQLGEGLPFSKLKMRSVYCLPHATSAIRQYSLSGKMLISLMSLFVVACIYATISDYLGSRNNTQTPVKALITTTTTTATTSVDPTPNGERKKNCDSGYSADSTQDQSRREERPARVKLVLANENQRTWRNVLVESFSLIQNFNKLTAIREPKPEDCAATGERQVFNTHLFFGSITGIKCIGLLWIIAAHTFLVGPIPNSNLIHLDKITQTTLANLLLSAHLMVDSFFALSGVLASYMIFKAGIQHIKVRQWIVLTVHRYWRLTPIYMLCYWFAKELGHLTNGGPFWDYRTAAQSPRLNCANESWLYAILQMSDFKSPKHHCVPFAWFIANGIKFWMVTPLFLVAIYKSIRRGYTMIGAGILANCAIVFMLAFNSNVDMKSVIEFKPESADNMLNDMGDIYTRPYSRIGAYLVGLLAGHLFYTIERDQKQFRLSDKANYLIWLAVSSTMILFAFIVKLAGGIKMDEAVIPWVFSFISAIMRPVWAACTCWLVFALANGQVRWLSSILCAKGWSLLGKLSFSAYLVQGEVIANLYLAVNHSTPFVYDDLVCRSLYSMVATIAVAFLMTIFVEYPLIGIEELILPAKKSKSNDKLSQDTHEKDNKTVIINDNKVSRQQQQQVSCDRHTPTSTISDAVSGKADKLKEL